MDAQPTISHTVALGGFVRALITYLRETPVQERVSGLPQTLNSWFEKENHYQASRCGLDAAFVFDNEGNTCSLRSVLQTVIDAIRPVAEELGQAGYFELFCEHVVKDPCYARQRAIYKQTNSLRKVTESLVAELAAEAAESCYTVLDGGR